MAEPVTYTSARACAEAAIAHVGRRVVLGLPLGLGKANHLANAFYELARDDPSLDLVILTGLTLERPRTSNILEERLMGPIAERLFGDWPDLKFALDRRAGTLPDNVTLKEFFFSPGSMLHNENAQRNHISANYTHVARDVLGAGLNVMAQMVARETGPNGPRYSLSCNPDISLDVMPELRRQAAAGRKVAVLGEINDRLPFLANDAEVPAAMFDGLYEAEPYALFGTPARMVDARDHAIGLNASVAVKDGGSLQIGIGALGDAVANALIVRQRKNTDYLAAVQALDDAFGGLASARAEGGTERFAVGLYGCSEMVFDGFLHLLRAGVVRREVYDHPGLQAALNRGELDETIGTQTLQALVEQGIISERLTADDLGFLKRFRCIRDDIELSGASLVGADGRTFPADLSNPETLAHVCGACMGQKLGGGLVLEGAFYLGSPGFYEALRGLSETDRARINMTSVTKINDLYGEEGLRRLQRLDARFVNSGLMATALGAVVSDGLDDGRVLSGVGGQYNFVAMAHELEGARSVITIRSTRTKGGITSSNIPWTYGHETIPRHLRDMVVTEYGVADLRGQPDHVVVERMIAIADSRFQDPLVRAAKAAGKLPSDYQVPERHRHNSPERLALALDGARRAGHLPDFPFGTDLTETELALARALRPLAEEAASLGGKWRIAAGAVLHGGTDSKAMPYLERMGFARPRSLRDRLLRRLIVSRLRRVGVL